MSRRIDKATIRRQLDRMFESRVFAGSERMRQFLDYVVAEQLAGRADTLKESVIAHAVHGRPADFDGGTDPIVRVDARRLRDKLREYYAENPDDPIVIDLPKGGYAPDIRANTSATRSEPDPAAEIPARRPVAVIFALAILLLAAGILWIFRGPGLPQAERDAPNPSAGPAQVNPVPVTSYLGHEIDPSLSPDGSMLAFAWDGGESAGFDIYVKVIGEDDVLQLTFSAADEHAPAWSPDGRWIAFVREGNGTPSSIHLVPPLGGAPRRVVDGSDVSWGADSQSLFLGRTSDQSGTRAIHRYDFEGRDLEQVTFPEGHAVDLGPAASPVTGELAFTRCATPARQNCDIFVADPEQPMLAERLTHLDLPIGGPAWMPAGDAIVFSASGALYRVDRSGSPSVPLRIAGASPALSSAGDGWRLAFRRQQGDSGIWRSEVLTDESSNPAAIGASERFIDSTRGDNNPVMSPDGELIVFASNRQGPWEAWAADKEGRNTRLFSGAINGQFSWSPDSARVAGLCVDARDDRNDVCVVDAATGSSITVAASEHVDGMPFWSSDGETLYFTSDRSGEAEIWAARVGELEAERLTDGGALAVAISHDHRFLYYLRDTHLTPENWARELWRYSLADGTAEKMLDRVYPSALADSASGLYWLDFADGRDEPPLVNHIAHEDGRIRELGRLEQPVTGRFPHLAVAPDESYLYTAHDQRTNTDIFSIDGR